MPFFCPNPSSSPSEWHHWVAVSLGTSLYFSFSLTSRSISQHISSLSLLSAPPFPLEISSFHFRSHYLHLGFRFSSLLPGTTAMIFWQACPVIHPDFPPALSIAVKTFVLKLKGHRAFPTQNLPRLFPSVQDKVQVHFTRPIESPQASGDLFPTTFVRWFLIQWIAGTSRKEALSTLEPFCMSWIFFPCLNGPFPFFL